MEKNKKNKTILIKVRDEAEKTGLRELSIAALMDRVKLLKKKRGDILAVRRLPSGDLELLACTVEARERMEKNERLLKKLALTATMVQRTYAVMAHGIRIDSVNTLNSQAFIKSLIKQNERLHPGLQISRITWTRRALTKAKIHSSLIIEIATAAMANRFIKEGLLQEFSHRICEYFDRSSRMKQCFQCQNYGHIGIACKNAARCDACAQEHNTKDCKTTSDRRKCAQCGGKHQAWAHDCPVRREEQARLNDHWNNRPATYVETPAAGHERDTVTEERQRSVFQTPTRILSKSRSASETRSSTNRFASFEVEDLEAAMLTQSSYNDDTNSFPAPQATHGKRAHFNGPGEVTQTTSRRRRNDDAVSSQNGDRNTGIQSPDHALKHLKYRAPIKPKLGRPPLARISGNVSNNTQ